MWISVCRPTRAPPEERGPEPNSMGRGARPQLLVLKSTCNRVSKELSRSCNHDTLCHFTDSQTADTRRHGVPRQASMQLGSSPIPRVDGARSQRAVQKGTSPAPRAAKRSFGGDQKKDDSNTFSILLPRNVPVSFCRVARA